MWTSCPAFRLTRISVHITAWTTAKPVTSDRPVLGSVAREANHAASRRIDGMRREREAVGKMDAVDMDSLRSAFSAQVESAWREETPLKYSKMVAARGCECYPAPHDNRPHFQHPQLLHRRPYRPWQIDAGRPPDPDDGRADGPRNGGQGAGARFHGYRARARYHHQGADGA